MKLPRPTLSRETLAAIRQAQDREQLTDCLGRIARETGASHYLLLLERHVRGKSQPLVVASNWIFDAVQTIGAEAIERLAHAAAPQGVSMQALRPSPGGADRISADQRLRETLRRLGHVELHALPLRDASRRCHLLLSCGTTGAIDLAMLPSAQLACCYLLARPFPGLFDDQADEVLSDRERECLYWVAEGKTASEVAMILGVTANTVNSYLSHAIRKVGASNRAMAIATAIRAGVI
ncbi:helix-turn-helix domain-containing protein [Aquibium sp. ELW1220]|uniref:helix-turn-helix transcriptional regulator n=1 Tax=Aquibium sp. ELW1220 TaxID=2976766 RepID=UPI0025B16218|nr:helix-turn-helix domain-containing protein [Aquibium sp. ELW1220]MDN2580785.1 helix-turn-helix domain-containing protein [Aquibium sp. ELW1220]